MRAVALDAERLAQLRVFDDCERREIVGGAVRMIAEQLNQIDAALAAGDHRLTAEAAHGARNEALIMGALELCAAFARLEQAARQRDQTAARAAKREADAAWPATRQAIAQLADRLDGG